MKCDELKPLVFSIADLAYVDEIRVTKNFQNPHDHAVYKATEVDAAIEELKDIIKNNQSAYYVDLGIVANDCEKLKADSRRLKKKMDDYHLMSDIRRAKIKELKRALWLARAERAEARKNYWYARSIHEGDIDLRSIDGSAVKNIGCIKRTNYDWLLTWSEVESRCRAKAEEYK